MEPLFLQDDAPVQTLAKAAASRPASGRPRDPGMEARVLAVAASVFAREGWRGLTFDAVAREAGVGKSSLYRRWPDRAQLFAATLDARWREIGQIDGGALRQDLIELSRKVLALLSQHDGGFALNFQADARRHPELEAIAAPFRQQLVARLADILTRGIKRGEMRGDVSLRLVIDCLFGALMNRVSYIDSGGNAPDANERFLVALVDMVLTGIGKEGNEDGRND